MKHLLAIAFVFLPTLAAAQDISIKMKEIAPGSWFLMEEGGKPAMHVFRGKRGQRFIYDYVPGSEPNGKRAFRDYRDASGNNTKRVFSNGRVVTYVPHNCQRVVGQCSFVERGRKEDGLPYSTKMVRVNTPSGTGFSFKQVAIAESGKQISVRSGSVRELDKMGMLRRGEMTEHATGATRKYRKVKASWD